MKVTITVPDTVFGSIEKEFTTMIDALHFVQACIANDANCFITVDDSHEEGEHWLELRSTR
jgi:hypothetical protein